MIEPEFLVIIICISFIGFVLIGYKNHVADWGGFTINVVDGWIRIYCRYFHHFIYQPIPVSDNGPTLLACNHLSGLDPFLVVAACRHPIRFMIAKEEYERFGLQWLFRAAGCIPVERSGRVEIAFRITLSALHNGEVVALFPEGGINRTGRPLRKLKAGIIKLAKMADVPITALRVEGMRGQGHTGAALLLPSQSRLYVLPELDCGNKTDEDGLIQLALFLSLRD
ncbi:MAG: 1-acyl-sn-glycerol-3-phosphate acyltransferase [Gammaproteobacteria bacterium]|nr:1-acyl-sn-glycerol-3-phosphate acyltransferase [Gammaproteobacteria bacterium]